MFIGKSRICRKTEMSGALDNPNFHGNTLLLDLTNPECNSLGNNEKQYLFISGFYFIKFPMEDKLIDLISIMGNRKHRIRQLLKRNTLTNITFLKTKK